LGEQRRGGGQGQNDQGAFHGSEIARHGAACNWTRRAPPFRLITGKGDQPCASFGAAPVPAM
jgi:hypothetical protein